MDDNEIMAGLRAQATSARARGNMTAAHLFETAAARMQKLVKHIAKSAPEAGVPKRRVINGKRQVQLGGWWYPDDDESHDAP